MSAAPIQPPPRRLLIEAIIASTIGTTIEWYDFFLYGIAVDVVFSKLYFPSDLDDFSRRMLAYSTFTIGFLARPLGGVVFGYMGDRLGRKSALVTTLLLMGVSTVLIGFLPTYAEIGIAAPIILTLLRFLQGLGVGGEWGGAVLLALEYGSTGRRGFVASWPQAGVPLGLLAANGAMALCQHYTGDEFLVWGWRIPFYLSGMLILVGLLIRMRITETPLFLAVQEKKEVAKAPVTDTIRQHWRDLLLIAGMRITENASFYLFVIWIATYNNRVLHIGLPVIMLAVNVAAICEFFTIPMFGFLSDRLSRRSIYIFGCTFLFLFALPYYALLDTGETIWIICATVLGVAVGHAMLYSVQASLIPELFGTRLRCTGASIGYQLAVPLSGGIAPLIATTLIEVFKDQYWPVAAYIMINSAISLACVLLLAETSRKDIGT